MEEAYSELYRQFLNLRSLCLRQAALLHQLTAALQKQQGITVPKGESDMVSIPIQCSQDIPVCHHEEKPHQQTASALIPAVKCCTNVPSRNVEIFTDLLAEDMSKLGVGQPPQKKDDGNFDQQVAPLVSVDFLNLQEASLRVPRTLGLADRFSGDRTMRNVTMPASEDRTPVGDLWPSGGIMMSDMALQSHVCEFCQAVFPGDTTTRGEFLRHLYTHVT